jgi:hypothetical protein
MSEREPSNMKDIGPRKYRERIHKESKYADTHKNLPFSFSKPLKEKARNVLVECSHCERMLSVNEDTIVVVCGGCSKITRVKDRK